MAHLVELFVKLIELRRLRHHVLVHQEWRLDLSVSPLAQKVEPVRDESLIEVDTIIREEVSTMTRDLGTCKTLSGDKFHCLHDRHLVQGPLHQV